MLQYRSVSRRIFEVFLYGGFTLFCLAIILPFLNVIAVSLSSKNAHHDGQGLLLARGALHQGLRGHPHEQALPHELPQHRGHRGRQHARCSIFIALCAGYALSSRHFFGAKVAFIYILIPMYFSAAG